MSDKPATTPEQQVEIMRGRGLIIADESDAIAFLSMVNYYRFGFYAYCFQNPKDVFIANTKFEEIVKFYKFNEEIRQLLFNYIGKIEIYSKSLWIDLFGTAHGGAGIYKAENYSSQSHYDEITKKINENIAQNKSENFVKNQKRKNRELDIWVVLQNTTFSTFSKLVSCYNKKLPNSIKKDLIVIKIIN